MNREGASVGRSLVAEESARAGYERVVRVFVSSTFRDMQLEREELVKRVFPQLRKLCELRGAIWAEVDLRWGITDEQKAEGKVLPICLEEINNCRPYFIGLLGERYGWVPREIDSELVKREPWLTEHCQKSVTELEILHGVMRNPAMADHAFFYLRSPSYAKSFPREEQTVLLEGPEPEEIEEFGAQEAQRRAEERLRRLRELKHRIRESGLPVREDYPDPEALGRLVLDDLTGVIDRLYPEGSEPEPLDREATEHEMFAASRARVYIGRSEYFERLDSHARGNGPPLVVLGESGSGKSALLANWALRYREAHRGELVLMHFIGATTFSAEWDAMLRRFLGELERRIDLGLEVPEQPNLLRATFANALSLAARRGRIVLVLDALNQLEDREGALDLLWLPEEIPENVRVVVSSLPGRPLEELTRRRWPTLEVRPLELDERERVIAVYLSQYRKALSPARVRRIAESERAGNPLYLRALVDELRVWGDHFKLDERIDHYLAARTVDDLYERILERYEEDYERDRPGLVRDTMSLLWAARRGLSEAELLDLLGSNGEPLPRAFWSPLYLAVEQSLISRSGLIGFFHDYLRKAVGDRYLKGEGERRRAHRRLGEYFVGRPLFLGAAVPDAESEAVTETPDLRKIDEQAWQFFRAGADRELVTTLADVRLVVWHAAVGRYDEIRRFWRGLADVHPIVETYQPQLDRFKRTRSTTEYVEALNAVGHLYADLGHRSEAAELLQEGLTLLKDSDDYMSFSTAHSYGNLAVLLTEMREFDRAEQAFLSARAIAERLAPRSLLSVRELNNLTSFYLRRGNIDKADAMCRSALAVMDALDEHRGSALLTSEHAQALANRSRILERRRDWRGAIEAVEEAVRLAQRSGNVADLPELLYRLAALHHSLDELQDAESALTRAGELLSGDEVGPDYVHQALVTANLAQTKLDQGDLDAARTFFPSLAAPMRSVTSLEDPALVGGIRALMRKLQDQGLLQEAVQICQDAIAMVARAKQEGSRDHSTLLHDLTGLYAKQGKHELALATGQEAFETVRELGDTEGIIGVSNRLAGVHKEIGDLDRARMVLAEGRSAARRAGAGAVDIADLGQTLGDVCREQARWGDAEAAYRDAVHEYESAGGTQSAGSMGRCLAKLADVLEKTGRSPEAEDCYLRAISVEEAAPEYEELLADTISNYALLLSDLERNREAIALHERTLAIREALLGPQHELVGRTLSYLGLSHFREGDVDQALSLFGQALSVFRSTLGEDDPRTTEIVLTVELLGGGSEIPDASEPEAIPPQPPSAPEASAESAKRGPQAAGLEEVEMPRAATVKWDVPSGEVDETELSVASLGNQASVLEAKGDYAGALALLEEQEQLLRNQGDTVSLQACLAAQAFQQRHLGDLDQALVLLSQQEQLCRDVGDPGPLERSLRHQSDILTSQLSSLAELGTLFSAEFVRPDVEGESDSGSAEDFEQQKAAFETLAGGLRERGELHRAAGVLHELERIERELGNRRGLERCLQYQLLILLVTGRDREGPAMTEWFDEQERILRELGEDGTLQLTLANKSMHEGFMLADQGNFSEAIAKYRDAEKIYRSLENDDALNFCLECQLRALRDEM